MQRLTVPDAAWLLIESAERPMHVGGVMLFEPPPDAADTWLQEVVAEALLYPEVRPPMNRRLHRPYGLLGTYAWVEDEVDLTYHVRHLALPQPGRIRELLSLVSRMHGALLDRHRPLWELYLVEGLADGRVALYGKFHHSLLDGIAAVRQILAAFSPDPDERDLPPPWAARPETAPRPPRPIVTLNPATTLARAAGGAVKQTTAALGASRALGGQLLGRLRDAVEAVPFEAPDTMLNVRLTASRRVVAQSYAFERIRGVAKATDATVNDVMLAMCGGALRAYLAAHDALPARPLIALVPVNIRDDDTDAGNAITFLLANLATHEPDPLDRLERVRASMTAGKERLGSMTRAERQNYGLALATPLVVGQLSGLSARLPPLYNVVISNVPGPGQALYWNGARLDGLYPVSLLADGLALNITQTSYAGSMEFGITADRKALPRIQRLIDHLEDELAALERAAGV